MQLKHSKRTLTSLQHEVECAVVFLWDGELRDSEIMSRFPKVREAIVGEEHKNFLPASYLTGASNPRIIVAVSVPVLFSGVLMIDHMRTARRIDSLAFYLGRILDVLNVDQVAIPMRSLVLDDLASYVDDVFRDRCKRYKGTIILCN